MYSEIYYPVVERPSVPRVYRRYHYQHAPPPSDPTEFMAELRRGLRGAKQAGFWGKMKSAAWRFLLKSDYGPEQTLRPDFPVAAPPTPVPCSPRISPDIYIIPAGYPDYLLSPPPPQDEGFLVVPARSSRSTRSRRQERRPSRPLPTPPGPPAYPIPEISCCSWANSPSMPLPSAGFVNSDSDPEAIACARFFAEVAPFLFLAINESSSEDEGDDDDEQDSSDTSTDAASSDNASGHQDDAMTLSSTQTEEIRDVATDMEFLKDIGLSPEVFIALLDGAAIPFSDDDASQG